jgi:signal transduction histidine kinase/CheY-like chemotaxis protein
VSESVKIAQVENWTIQKVEVDHIFVTNGTVDGIIDRSEISYFRLDEDLKQRFSVGQKIRAMVLSIPDSGPIILGIKQIDDPAWKRFAVERRTGAKVYGQVLRIHQHEGALIQIEHTGGVIGRIPAEETIDVGKGDTYLLAGDQVRALLIGFDDEHRCAVLSLARLIQSKDIWNGHSTVMIGELFGEELKLLSLRMGLIGQHSYDPAIRKLKEFGIQTILFCDDDEQVCETYRQSFEIAGFNVILAHGGKDGIEKGSSSNFDLAVIDLNMDDIDGCEVAKAIRQARPEVSIIIVSGTSNYKKHGYGEKLRQSGLYHSVVRKPFTIKDISTALERSDRSAVEVVDLAAFVDILSQLMKESFKLEDTLERILEHIKEVTSADSVCVFTAHAIDPRIKLVAVAGDFPLEFDQDTLNRSPVKDVITEERKIIDFEIPESARFPGHYYSNLYKIYACRSIIAQPLNLYGDQRYALFIMSRSIKKEWHRLSFQVPALAEVVATSIERKLLEEIFVSHQQFYMIGQISSSLIHELKNEEQIISNSILQLAYLAQNVQSKDKSLTYADEKFQADFHFAVDTLVKYNERIGKIQNLFLTFQQRQEIEKVDLARHIELLVETLQPYAKDQKVQLSFQNHASSIPEMDINLPYLNQILINLIMNSVEQTRRIRKASGKVEVSCKMKNGDRRCIQISVKDNGPGIHEVHRSRIFDLLFTSKPKGTGIGLYISRVFARALQAKLFIEYTCRFDGTIMTLELPIK